MKYLTSAFAGLLLAALTAPLACAALAPGQAAPAFALQDLNGKTRNLSEFSGKYVVLEWHNRGCPFVVKHYESGNLPKLQREWTQKGVAWLTISSSAPGKQGNQKPEEIRSYLEEKKAAPTAYLLDPTGVTGKAYGAKTTPHMFVIDPKGTLIYAGAIDDKPSTEISDIASAKNYVSTALTESMAGKPVTTASSKAYGCSVKYAD